MTISDEQSERARADQRVAVVACLYPIDLVAERAGGSFQARSRRLG